MIGVLVNHQTEPVLFPNFDLDKSISMVGKGQADKNLTNHSDFFFYWLSLVPDYSVPCSHLLDQIHVARLPDISADNSLRMIRPQSFLHVEGAAHARISWGRLKDVCKNAMKLNHNLNHWKGTMLTCTVDELAAPLTSTQ